MEKNKEIELEASFFEYKKDIKVKITLLHYNYKSVKGQ